jgi:hypothetical protein
MHETCGAITRKFYKNISGSITGSCIKYVGLSRENLRKILVGASRVQASNMWGCHEKLLKKNISGGFTG